ARARRRDAARSHGRPGQAGRGPGGPLARGARDPGRASEDAAGDAWRTAEVVGRMTSQVGRDLTDALAAVVERLRRVTVQVRAQNATAGAGLLWPGERPQ